MLGNLYEKGETQERTHARGGGLSCFYREKRKAAGAKKPRRSSDEEKVKGKSLFSPTQQSRDRWSSTPQGRATGNDKIRGELI